MKYEKIVQEYRDERSMELYGKPESQLMISEVMNLNKYIHDYENPVWKPIVIDGNATNYEVSNIGKVRNINSGKILKAIKDKDGYSMIFIKFKNKLIGKGIHRFVAQAFIPNPENKPQVNHISGIKSCNWVGNLEWVTCQENIIKAHEIGLYPDQKGSNNYNSKYTIEDIIRAYKIMTDSHLTYDELAHITGMSRTMLWNIKHGKRWSHIKLENMI